MPLWSIRTRLPPTKTKERKPPADDNNGSSCHRSSKLVTMTASMPWLAALLLILLSTQPSKSASSKSRWEPLKDTFVIGGGREAIHVEAAPNLVEASDSARENSIPLAGIRRQDKSNHNLPLVPSEGARRFDSNVLPAVRPPLPPEEPRTIPLAPPQGARRLDSVDVVIYDDIYPKRVPKRIHRERADRAKELDIRLRRIRHRKRHRRQRRLYSHPPRPHHKQSFRQERARSYTDDSFSSSSSVQEPLIAVPPLPASSSSSSSSSDVSLFRSFLGVSPFCLNDDVQFSCKFTPTCWLQGGIPQPGCDSMLYSCCVSPGAISRKVRDLHVGKLQFHSFNCLSSCLRTMVGKGEEKSPPLASLSVAPSVESCLSSREESE